MNRTEITQRLGGIKLFLFDLDGTLVNTMRVWTQMTHAFLDKLGMAVTDEEIAAMDKMSFEEGSHHMRTVIGVPMTHEEFVISWVETAQQLYAAEAFPIPGALDVLARLKARGARLVLFSQSPRTLVEDVLPGMGLWDCFDGIFLSGETTAVKGSPEAVLEVVSAMGGTPAASAVVDDSPYAAQAAQEAGVLAIGAGWLAGRRDELERCADLVLDSIELLG